jgi:hypothetical protein
MTKAELILQTILTEATAALPSVNIQRSRTSSYDVSELPAINIMPADDDAINYAQSIDRVIFSVELSFHVPPQPVPDAAIDPLIEIIHPAITQSSALKNIIADIRYKSRNWDFDHADGSAAKVTLAYEITYLTNANAI